MKEYKFKINGNEYDVAINNVEGQEMSLNVNGVNYKVTVETELNKKQMVARSNATPQVAAAPSGSLQRGSSKPSGGEQKVISPLPGTIVDVKVNVGDAVAAGQCVLTLEAMKMENSIECESAGTVKEIKVKNGDSVLEGDVLVVIE